MQDTAVYWSGFGQTVILMLLQIGGIGFLTWQDIRQNTALAQELGASVETVFGDDVSYQIAEYARLSCVTKIVVGRSAVSKSRLFVKPTLTEKLTQIAPNMLARLRFAQRRIASIGVKNGDSVFRNGKLSIDYVAGCAYLESEQLKLPPRNTSCCACWLRLLARF